MASRNASQTEGDRSLARETRGHRVGPKNKISEIENSGPGLMCLLAAKECGSEECHRLPVETMLQGVVHQDGRGQIIAMNSAAEHILGKTRLEFLGSSSVQEGQFAIHEDGSPFPGEEHPSMEALRTGKPVRGVIMGVFNPRQNAYRWISVDALPLFREGASQAHEVYTVFVDITERKRAEQALRDALQQLADADHRKNDFLAMLSHELRNPLAPIRNSVYILQRAQPGSEQAQRALAVLDRQAAQLSRLVDDLLDVTRISRNKIQLQCGELDLNQLVIHSIEDQRSLFDQAKVRLQVNLANRPVLVNGDWNRLAQVVGNLLQNAAKFTAAGGSTTVAVDVDTPAARAIIRVTDTGVGIEPAMLARLFQPFSQCESSLNRSKGGLGLGLVLVRGLVEMHGGDVSAHSRGMGTGTEFVVRLPLLKSDGATSKPSREERPGHRTGTFPRVTEQQAHP
jgi:PAS domain S-box-containing protein